MTMVPGRERRTLDLEAALLAIVLGLVALVPVAGELGRGHERFLIEEVGWHPLGTGEALILAAGSMIPASLLGGIAGGWVWRRWRVLAPLTALWVAWFVGIVALPLVAAATRIPLRDAIVGFDALEARLTDLQPLGGLGAYAEGLLAGVVAWPLLVVPVALAVFARNLRRPALAVAAGLALHAVIHSWSVGVARGIYVVLVAGVVIWTVWLWARDGGGTLGRSVVRRWTVVLVPAVLVMALSGAVTAATWLPAVPMDVATTVVGTAAVHGINLPDPSRPSPPNPPRTPEGRGCFDPLVRPEGRLDLCWEAHRDNREVLPGGDIYQFRLLATLNATVPTAWVVVTIDVPRDDRTRVDQLWPSGVLDGPCRTTAVEGMNFLTDGDLTTDVADDVACGRTTSATEDQRRRHWVIWTCARCGADGPGGRQIAIRELVGTAEGRIPTWTVSAAVGH